MKLGNQKIIQSKSVFLTIFLFISCLFSVTLSKCSDRPECFKKAVFNYNLPEMNLYQMNGTDGNLVDYSIKAYGDFNNDLYTDFIGVNEQRDILVFAWNSDTYLYEKVFEVKMVDQYIPKSVYLLDISGDGRLDFVIWGLKNTGEGQSQNCLVPYVRQIASQPEQLTTDNKYIFKNTTILTMPETSDPNILGHQFNTEIDGVGFLLFMNGYRTFLKYKEGQSGNPSFEPIKWSQIAESSFDFSLKPFHNPHWNTFLDLTGDCIPDLVVLNADKKLEIWIGDTKKFKCKYLEIPKSTNTLKQIPTKKNLTQMDSLSMISVVTFNKLDYDGSTDLILLYEKMIRVKLNHKSLTSEAEFCCNGCVNLDLDGPIDIAIPQGKTIKQQAVHFGDINIDGYPDLLMVLVDDNTKAETPIIFENLFDVGTNSFSPFKTPIYNDRLSAITEGSTVLSASFIDILENGYFSVHIDQNS